MTDPHGIAGYLSMSEEKLYEELGTLLLGSNGLGMGSSSRGRLRRYGREKWLDSQRRLRLVLCTPAARSRLTEGGTVLVQGIVSAVVEALRLEQAEAVVVAVLVVKMGLDRFCGGEDRAGGPDADEGQRAPS